MALSLCIEKAKSKSYDLCNNPFIKGLGHGLAVGTVYGWMSCNSGPQSAKVHALVHGVYGGGHTLVDNNTPLSYKAGLVVSYLATATTAASVSGVGAGLGLALSAAGTAGTIATYHLYTPVTTFAGSVAETVEKFVCRKWEEASPTTQGAVTGLVSALFYAGSTGCISAGPMYTGMVSAVLGVMGMVVPPQKSEFQFKASCLASHLAVAATAAAVSGLGAVAGLGLAITGALGVPACQRYA